MSDEGTRALIDVDDYKIKLGDVLAESRQLQARVAELEDCIEEAYKHGVSIKFIDMANKLLPEWRKKGKAKISDVPTLHSKGE